MTHQESHTQSKPLGLFALLLIGGVLFFANTWGYDLWPPDEPRFAEVAREMMQSGDFLVPHVNGEPYKEKPPLLFWAIALVSLPFGDVTEFSARAPSGIAALVTVLITYLLARRLYGARVAWWSGMVLMTTSFFWWEARSVRTDMLLTACMTGALYAFWRWHEDRRARWLVALYGAIALGLYTKGPPALVFPLLLAVFFYWKRGSERRQVHLAMGILTAVALVLLWFIPARMALPEATAQGTEAGIAGEAFRQIIGRFVLGVSKARPPWYYVLNLPVNLLPWSLFLPWTVLWLVRNRREDERMRLLLAWTVPAFAFFSISIGKRPVYLLPLHPALAILMARSVLDLMAGDRVVWRKRTAYLWVGLMMMFGAVPFALLFSEYRQIWSNGFIVFGASALGLSLHAMLRVYRTQMQSLHQVIAGHFAVVAALGALIICPAVNTYKGASDICRPLRELSEAGTGYRLYSVGFSREEYVFYSKHFHEPVLTDLAPPTLPPEVDMATMAKQLRALAKGVREGVDQVRVASLMAPTEAERAALAQAVHGAVQQAEVEAELAQAFEAALTNAVRQFEHAFHAPGQAFMFIPEGDWRYLIPLLDDMAGYTLVRHQSVGSRTVMLIANEPGAALIAGGARPGVGGGLALTQLAIPTDDL